MILNRIVLVTTLCCAGAPLAFAKRIASRDRKDLKQVVLVYDMRNDIARRYGAWSGELRGPMVKVTKSRPGR